MRLTAGDRRGRLVRLIAVTAAIATLPAAVPDSLPTDMLAGSLPASVLAGTPGFMLPVTVLLPEAAPSSGPMYESLRAAYNNVGISDNDDPATADLDGAGASFSAQDLARAGWRPASAITVAGARFTWPDVRPGEPDNVRSAGQTVRMSGQGSALSFLVTSTNGASSGITTITYADGEARSYRITTPDWHAGAANRQLVTVSHVNTPDGRRPRPAKLYALSVPLVRDKEIASVTLPSSTGGAAATHVFALAVRPDAGDWVGSWAASTSGLRVVGPWADQTLRLVARTSVGGSAIRIRLENTFAAAPVTVGRVTIARQRTGAVPDGEPTPLTFDDRTEVTIPAGGQVFSDPLTLAVPAQVNLLVSLYLPKPLRAAPVHHAALVANYITPAGAGDRTGDLNAASFTRRFYSWTLLSGVDVIPATRAGSVVFIGDSITDGVGAVVGAHRSWPEYVAARLLREPAAPGVLDAGISGNKVLADEYPGSGVVGRSAGTSAASRLQRDVLGQTGVRTVVVLEGINDLKGGAPAGQVIAGLKWIAAEARAYGLRVIAGTITPFQGWRTYTSWREANRQAVNAFIRNSGGVFDGHIDFDRAVRDPHNPHRLRPRYDSGDHLHPGGNGYRAMAYTVPLSALRPGESRS